MVTPRRLLWNVRIGTLLDPDPLRRVAVLPSPLNAQWQFPDLSPTDRLRPKGLATLVKSASSLLIFLHICESYSRSLRNKAPDGQRSEDPGLMRRVQIGRWP